MVLETKVDDSFPIETFLIDALVRRWGKVVMKVG